jgi:hypothetical protein
MRGRPLNRVIPSNQIDFMAFIRSFRFKRKAEATTGRALAMPG